MLRQHQIAPFRQRCLHATKHMIQVIYLLFLRKLERVVESDEDCAPGGRRKAMKASFIEATEMKTTPLAAAAAAMLLPSHVLLWWLKNYGDSVKLVI
ncbi:hypothetical protein M8C21_021504 [Ambrosia artemisiifolia]|uniref:Uncharacterized protein n=1 Tax=Ambrosia artemisiifolia TaxID=4212 RepID=A0AAD5C6I3_AMBAR|nr:hypothetical protein M8C21_021504 [Ambrosia artemisiifolia]